LCEKKEKINKTFIFVTSITGPATKEKENPAFVLCGTDWEEPAEKVEELISATGVTDPIGLDPDVSMLLN
jgi:hypothetical protein